MDILKRFFRTFERKGPDGQPRKEFDAERALVSTAIKCITTGQPQLVPRRHWETLRKMGKGNYVVPGPNYDKFFTPKT